MHPLRNDLSYVPMRATHGTFVSDIDIYVYSTFQQNFRACQGHCTADCVLVFDMELVDAKNWVHIFLLAQLSFLFTVYYIAICFYFLIGFAEDRFCGVECTGYQSTNPSLCWNDFNKKNNKDLELCMDASSSLVNSGGQFRNWQNANSLV